MSSNDNYCTAPQPIVETIAASCNIEALPSLQAAYGDTKLGETLEAYYQKVAERPHRPVDA